LWIDIDEIGEEFLIVGVVVLNSHHVAFLATASSSRSEEDAAEIAWIGS